MGRRSQQTLICDYCGAEEAFLVTTEVTFGEHGAHMHEVLQPLTESTSVNEWRIRIRRWMPGVLRNTSSKPTLHLVFCSEDHEYDWKSKYGDD